MMSARIRQAVALTWALLYAFPVSGEQWPLHLRSTKIAPTGETPVGCVVVRLFVGESDDGNSRYSGYLISFDAKEAKSVEYVRFDKSLDDSVKDATVTKQLPEAVGKRFRYAQRRVNESKEPDANKCATLFLNSLIDSTVAEKEAGTALIAIPVRKELWNVKCYEDTSRLVVETTLDNDYKIRLGFYSYHALATTLGDRQWSTTFQKVIRDAKPSPDVAPPKEKDLRLPPKLPAYAPKTEEDKSPFKGVSFVGGDPWTSLMESMDKRKLSTAVVFPRGEKESEEQLLIDRIYNRPLALPVTPGNFDLVTKAFHRGSATFDRFPISKVQYEELRSNALFPISPQPRRVLSWANFTTVKDHENALALALPVQWADWQGRTKASPTFYWKITNRYQQNLLNWHKLSKPQQEMGIVQFGRMDPTIEIDSLDIQFHDESDFLGDEHYLPRALHLWPEKEKGTSRPVYVKEGASVEADFGLRFCLVGSGADKEAMFYIQDREFTARHLINLWKPLAIREPQDHWKTGLMLIPKPKPKEPLSENGKLKSYVDSIARRSWTDLFWLAAAVAKIDFEGDHSERLVADARYELLLALKAFTARHKKWISIIEKSEKTNDKTEQGKAKIDWLLKQCSFEFAELVCLFEQRMLGWVELSESSRRKGSSDLNGPAETPFVNAYGRRIVFKTPLEDFDSPGDNEEFKRVNRQRALDRLNASLARYSAARHKLGAMPNSTINPLDWPIVGVSVSELKQMLGIDPVAAGSKLLDLASDQTGMMLAGQIPEGKKSDEEPNTDRTIKKWTLALPTLDQWSRALGEADPPVANATWVGNKVRSWSLRSLNSANFFRDSVRKGNEYPEIYNLFGNLSEFAIDKESHCLAVGHNCRETVSTPIFSTESSSSPAIGFRLVLVPVLPSGIATNGMGGSNPTDKNPATNTPRPNETFEPLLVGKKGEKLFFEKTDEIQRGAYPLLYGWTPVGVENRIPKWQMTQGFVHEYLGPHRFWEVEHIRNVLWGARGDTSDKLVDQLREDDLLEELLIVFFGKDGAKRLRTPPK